MKNVFTNQYPCSARLPFNLMRIFYKKSYCHVIMIRFEVFTNAQNWLHCQTKKLQFSSLFAPYYVNKSEIRCPSVGRIVFRGCKLDLPGLFLIA